MQELRVESEAMAREGVFRLTHEMLVLDAFLTARLNPVQYERTTSRFVNELLATLRMEPLGQLGLYPAVDRRAPGWSFVQPITTSHVCGHYFEKPGRSPHIRLDAYSCESVDWAALIAVCHRHFDLHEWKATFIERGIDVGEQRTVTELRGVGAQLQSETSFASETSAQNGGGL